MLKMPTLVLLTSKKRMSGILKKILEIFWKYGVDGPLLLSSSRIPAQKLVYLPLTSNHLCAVGVA